MIVTVEHLQNVHACLPILKAATMCLMFILYDESPNLTFTIYREKFISLSSLRILDYSFSLLLVPNSNETHMSFMWAFLLLLQSQLLCLAWFPMCGYQLLTHSTQNILMSSNPCAHANCFNIWSMHCVFLFRSTSNHKGMYETKSNIQYKLLFWIIYVLWCVVT